jgi:hypothetical protein
MKMKQIILFLLVFANCFSQTQKSIDEQKNSLYSAESLSKFKLKVDSLNLIFEKGSYKKIDFYSKPIAKAHFIILSGKHVPNAILDIEKKISFKDFIEKYKETVIDSNTIVLKHKIKSSQSLDMEDILHRNVLDVNNDNIDKEVLEFDGFWFSGYLNQKMIVNDKYFDVSVKGKWITIQNQTKMIGYYFIDEFESKVIPAEYLKMIQYSEIISKNDTNVIFKNAKEKSISLSIKYRTFSLEKKKELLFKFRNRYVVGNCGFDGRPTSHLLNIARLSAETSNWNIFLKSNLSLIFSNHSNSFYDFQKEILSDLELININIPYLTIGLGMRINYNTDNYLKDFNNGNRFKYPVLFSKKSKDIKLKLLQMIQDKNLDLYNRLAMYTIFLNSIYLIENKTEKEEDKNLLQQAIKSLPNSVISRLKEYEYLDFYD